MRTALLLLVLTICTADAQPSPDAEALLRDIQLKNQQLKAEVNQTLDLLERDLLERLKRVREEREKLNAPKAP
jgi:hypothetical protein